MLHKLVEDLNYNVKPSLKNRTIKIIGMVMYNFKKSPSHRKFKIIWDKYNNMPEAEVIRLKKKTLSDMTGIPSSKIWEYSEHDFACARGMFWITT